MRPTTIILDTSTIPDAGYRSWGFALIDSNREEVFRRDIQLAEVLEKATDRVTFDLPEDVLECRIDRALLWPTLADGTSLMKHEFAVEHDREAAVISPVFSAASRFERYVRNYRNEGWCNDAAHREFELLYEQCDAVRRHRDHVTANGLGFGDDAFHGMWLVLCEHLQRSKRALSFLEIGVFKGQVVSLWSLLSRELGFEAHITGISPFQGGTYGEDSYEDDDYEAAVLGLFETNRLPMDRVRLLKGLSTDVEVIREANRQRYDVVYIDGDHSFECVMADIENYGPMVSDGGYLVLDDASAFLEGSRFWKGHDSVSRAAQCLPDRGFENVLNVGHNRIYRAGGPDPRAADAGTGSTGATPVWTTPTVRSVAKLESGVDEDR